MKYVAANLLDDVSSGAYDQTKTMIRGRVYQKTIDGKDVLGPPLNKFIDVFTDSAVTPAAQGTVVTTNGRIFNIAAEASGLVVCSLHEFDVDTGDVTYIGKIQFNLPDTAATAHTYRAFKVIDTGTTGWKMTITTTGSVLINGGTFLINKIDKSDFVPVGFPTIPFASGNDQKAVYFLQDPSNIGVGQLQTASAGAALDVAASKLYVHNGIAATHQYYVYDLSVAPTYSVAAITGTEATNIINHAGHSFADNTPIRFDSLVGGAGLTNGTIYFVRNAVAGVSYEVSATSGGASINFTTDITSGNVGRAFGTTGSNFLHKTGNLPALTGTLILLDSEDYALPQHTANSGQACAFFATTTNLYLGQLAELTNGATSWPSLVTANILGATNEITAPTVALATWSNFIDSAIYTTNTNICVVKKMVNNQITNIFGGINNKYTEATSDDAYPFGFVTVSAMDIGAGWLAITGSTVGQRGVFLCDVYSNENFGNSYIVTKVMDTPSATLKFLTTIGKLYELTGSLKFQYRTSGFGSESGGWTDIPFAEDISGYAASSQVQSKVYFDTLGLDTSVHAQIEELFLGYESLNANSDNWEFSFDDTESSTPTKVSFRLKKAYASSVPELNFRSYSTADVLVVDHSTVTNPSFFEYSTDSGQNWNSLGTIPNTVGTLLRYTFASQPNVDIRPSLREA